MLYLVDKSPGFDNRKARELEKKGDLKRIASGVYCDKEDYHALPDFMRKNAIRIANYMLEDPVLVNASAYYKSAVESKESTEEAPMYTLFVAGKYKKTFNLPYLTIVQNDGLKTSKIAEYSVPYDDDRSKELGMMKIRCTMNEVIYLQNFGKRRYNLERYLDDDELQQLRKNLEQEHGSQLLSRLSTAAEGVGGLKGELEKAINYLSTPARTKLARSLDSSIIYQYHIGWYGRPTGSIRYDGLRWSYHPESGWVLPLSNETGVSNFPQFILNMLPQGVMLDALCSDKIQSNTTHARILNNTKRLLANITISADKSELRAMPLDVRDGQLNQHIDNHQIFTGTVSNIPKLDEDFMRAFSALVQRPMMPKYSGVQAKLPMHLDQGGNLSPAEFCAFTHILKLPGYRNDDPHQARGMVEWLAMTLVRAGGVKTCDFALIEVNDLLCYVTERFDIGDSKSDPRRIFAEDLCAALGLAPQSQFFAEVEEVCDVLKKVSTKYDEDKLDLFRQLCASTLIENGDMHLKNMSLVKVAEPMLEGFESVRLAPAYDVMNTTFFSSTIKQSLPVKGELIDFEPMTLKFNGKALWTKKELIGIADYLGIDKEEALGITRGIAENMLRKARELAANTPDLIESKPIMKKFYECVLDRLEKRCYSIFPDLAPEEKSDQKKSSRRSHLTVQ